MQYCVVMTLTQQQRQRVRLIKALMGWHDVTGVALARILGMSQQMLQRKLAGLRRFTDDELLACADAFNVDPGLLLRPDPVAELFGWPVPEGASGLVRSTFRQERRSELTRYTGTAEVCPSCDVDAMAA